MRRSLREILKSLHLPSIHVTHDREEALAVADRVAILEAGRLAQIGPPEEVHRRPASAFVARFVGQANLVPGRVTRASGGDVAVSVWNGISVQGTSDAGLANGEEVEIVLRPETFQIVARGPSDRGWNARVK